MKLLANDLWHEAVGHCIAHPGHRLAPYTDGTSTVHVRCSCGFDTAATEGDQPWASCPTSPPTLNGRDTAPPAASPAISRTVARVAGFLPRRRP